MHGLHTLGELSIALYWSFRAMSGALLYEFEKFSIIELAISSCLIMAWRPRRT